MYVLSTIMVMLYLLNHCKLAKLSRTSLILNIINHIRGGESWSELFFIVTIKKRYLVRTFLNNTPFVL